MGPGRYAFFLVVFFASGILGYLDISSEEEEGQNYAAKDEIKKFIDKLAIFGKEYGKTWMVIPNDDGKSEFTLLESRHLKYEERFLANYHLSEMPQHVKLFLYTKELPEGKQLNPLDFTSSDFDSSKPTKIILHGWMSNANSSVITKIRDAYLENQEVNVIGVDWSSISNNIFYPAAAAAALEVGTFLGRTINLLVDQKKAEYNDFHLIGHSLGAHISGFAGNNTRRKIGRITGLDPALPGFQFSKGPADRLDASDANFVDIIHTCAGILGMSITTGHVDFYPNGGSPFQPGCNKEGLPTSIQICSHGRSHELFAESIRHSDFKAVGCKNWNQFKENKCQNIYTYMGEYASPKVRGPFYLKTDNAPPFALGLNGTFF